MLETNLRNRKELIKALEEEFIGPISRKEGMLPLDKSNRITLQTKDDLYKKRYYQKMNGEEIIQRGNPSAHYVSGMIYPFSQKAELEDVDYYKEQEDDSVEEAISIKLVKELEDRIQNLEEQDNEFTEEVVSAEDLLPQKNEYKPSSFGISFYYKEIKQDKLSFVFTAGRYLSQPVFAVDDSLKQIWWFRTPINKKIILSVEELSSAKMIIRELEGEGLEGLKIYLKILCRKQEDGKYLITASITNQSELDGKSQTKLDEKALFQCKLEVMVEKGEILPYVLNEKNEHYYKLDQDEKSNELLYRNVYTYASGHGCSTSWEDRKRVQRISTTFLPQYETESMTPDIKDALGNEFSISMFELGDNSVTYPEVKAILENMLASYEVWILEKEKDISNLNIAVQEIAKEHIEKCYVCLQRMKSGVQLLEREDVFRAFKLANQAMIMQQVNGINPRDGIYINGSIEYSSPYKTLCFEDEEIKNQGKGKWRAFQIAFILMTLESTINKESFDRELVDLIWFPTGGGKTEAYLGIAAFSMFYRRIKDKTDIGVDILMRYTLRLLTADQFQRSSRLICSMEIIRRKNEELLGKIPYSIGIWLGSETTPNNNSAAQTEYRKLVNNKRGCKEFIVHNCPWCGAKLGYYTDESKNGKVKKYKDKLYHGYKISREELILYCPDEKCDFHNELPIYIVDETIYKKTPTFLIGTIDKFAMLSWVPEARSIFGINRDGERIVSPPNLIIQDELHLISGSLGTIAGLYETLIEELCSDNRYGKKVKPKIICATATIRRYKEQICSIYARERAQVFPSPGLEYNDSFFARPAKDAYGKNMPGRLYVGIYSPTVEKLSLQVKAYGTLLQRVGEFTEEEKDPFYTLLAFYNSIREIGAAMTLVQTDIPNYFKQVRLNNNIVDKEKWRWINNARELTSRLTSGQVTNEIGNLKQQVEKGEYPIDICLASNIIEVGVDIDRLSLMTIVGQPKTTAQYIQVSGRVGRRWWERPGLIITLYGNGKSRDKSHYEHFNEYHQQLYGQVEPTSVTPFSDPCLHRVLPGVIIGYLRQMLDKDIAQSPKNIRKYKMQLEYLRKVLVERVNIVEPKQKDSLIKEYNNFVKNYLLTKIPIQNWSCKMNSDDRAIMYMAGTHVTPEQQEFTFPVMTSMRNVDAQCKGKISVILNEDSDDLFWDEGEDL